MSKGRRNWGRKEKKEGKEGENKGDKGTERENWREFIDM